MNNKQTTFFVADVGDLQLWVDKYQFILKKEGATENTGYFSSLTQLTHYLFDKKIKMKLKEKRTLQEIVEVVKESEKNVVALADKIEKAAIAKMKLN